METASIFNTHVRDQFNVIAALIPWVTPTAIGSTSTDGYILSNATAAAAGAQQWSPRMRWTGQGWKTDATAASRTVDWIAEVVPVQGAANPTSQWQLSSQINAGGYTAWLALTSAGVLTVNGFGTHSFSAGGTGGNNLSVRNTAAGTGNQSQFLLGNDADIANLAIYSYSSTYTSAGRSQANGVLMEADNAGGLSISAVNASGVIRLYTGGTTRRALYDTDGTVTFDVYGAGTATFSAAGKFSSVSDERLKDINGPLGYGLAEVLQLSPIRYFWTDDSGLNDPKHTEYGGFGAGNVKTHMPLAVGVDGRGYLTLSDRPILAATVTAIQELNARLVALETRIH